MLNYMLTKCQHYGLLFIVILTALTVVPHTIQSQRSESSLDDGIELALRPAAHDAGDAKKAELNKTSVVKISNFPVKGGRLTSGFGMRKDPFHGKRRMHKGIDIAAIKGTFVYPMGDGKVIYSGRKAGYGKTVEIQHGNTVVTRYAHLEMLLIEKGREVSKDDVIGLVGRTGRSTGAHLHLEVTLNDKIVDPEIFLIGDLASR